MAEIRRALYGMRHDASEGHRLLREAYERDPDSLGPIQALSAFSRSHRAVWGSLRERLPLQLGDVGDEVSSVFDAIDEEVAPLESLLPEQPAQSGEGKRHGGSGSASTGTSGSDRSARPSAGGSGSSDGHRSSRPSNSADSSGSAGEGLLGGNTGGLLDPPKDTGSSGSSSSTPTPTTEPAVTLPPLLPGLLPGLGIEGEDAN